MHRVRFLALWIVLAGCAFDGQAAPARIIKVLPHLLDREGRSSLSPSLYERDAYQLVLRKNPAQCTGLRFDVQWRAGAAGASHLKLRLEILGSKTPKPLTLERAVPRSRWFHRWNSITLDRDGFQQVGEVVAWRATIWEGDKLLAEQKSFLW